MEALHLDTHMLVWLAMGDLSRLSQSGRAALESASSLLCSPMARLELAYLEEVGRIANAAGILPHLADALGLALATSPWAHVVERATSLRFTRDPFDRLIAAHADVDNAGLLTADRVMLKHYPRAFT